MFNVLKPKKEENKYKVVTKSIDVQHKEQKGEVVLKSGKVFNFKINTKLIDRKKDVSLITGCIDDKGDLVRVNLVPPYANFSSVFYADEPIPTLVTLTIFNDTEEGRQVINIPKENIEYVTTHEPTNLGDPITVTYDTIVPIEEYIE